MPIFGGAVIKGRRNWCEVSTAADGSDMRCGVPACLPVCPGRGLGVLGLVMNCTWPACCCSSKRLQKRIVLLSSRSRISSNLHAAVLAPRLLFEPRNRFTSDLGWLPPADTPCAAGICLLERRQMLAQPSNWSAAEPNSIGVIGAFCAAAAAGMTCGAKRRLARSRWRCSPSKCRSWTSKAAQQAREQAGEGGGEAAAGVALLPLNGRMGGGNGPGAMSCPGCLIARAAA